MYDDDVFTRNWLFLGTSGVHGTHGDLDDEEKKFDLDGEELIGEGHCDDEESSAYQRWLNKEFSITALVVMPRRVSTAYGNAIFRRDEIPWLRTVVTNTLKGIASSQEASMSKWSPTILLRLFRGEILPCIKRGRGGGRRISPRFKKRKGKENWTVRQ